MENEIKNFIKNQIAEGASIEDILSQCADAANEIEKESKEKENEAAKISEALETASAALKEVIKIETASKDVDEEALNDALSPTSLHFIVKMAVEVADKSADLEKMLLDSIINPFGTIDKYNNFKKNTNANTKEEKSDDIGDIDNIVSNHLKNLFK